MRIFLASSGVRAAHGRHALWAVNLIDPLIDLGHEVVVSSLDWDSAMDRQDDRLWLAAGRAELSQRLLDEIRLEHARRPFDLFFSYFYSAHVESGAIAEIRKLGIPTINFYCNAAHQFHLVREIAPAFDYCWVPERQALAFYRAAGANPLHVQMGANPSHYRPLNGVSHDVDVSFAGMLYTDRAQWLARILNAGVRVAIFTGTVSPGLRDENKSVRTNGARILDALADLGKRGPLYLARRVLRYQQTKRAMTTLGPFMHPPQPDLVRLFNRSRCVLNLSHVYDGGLPGGATKAHVRLREFEAPLCRALYFPQWCEELGEYFDLDREVVAWNTAEELADRIRYFEANRAAAERVREAGHRRTLSEHTAQHRFLELFRKAGVSTKTARA